VIGLGLGLGLGLANPNLVRPARVLLEHSRAAAHACRRSGLGLGLGLGLRPG
jgi:hypothetical protein